MKRKSKKTNAKKTIYSNLNFITQQSPSRRLQTAIQLHNTGNLQQAEIHYRQILRHDPQNSDAFHLLGLIAYQVKKYDAAISCMKKAISLNPSASIYHLNIGNVFKAQGQLNTALKCYQKALSFQSYYPDAHYNCGIISHNLGNLDDAIDHYKKTLALKPDHARAHNNLGNVLREKGDLDTALFHYREALNLDPEHAFAHNNVGNILKIQGDQDAALRHYQTALQINPQYADAHYNMGIILKDRHQLNAAAKHFRKAIHLQPDYHKAHLNLGILLHRNWKLGEAIRHYHEAILLKPDLEDAYNNLGVVLKEQGKLEEAYKYFNKALEIKPEFSEAHSNLLLNLHYHASLDTAYIFSEHQRWAQQHTTALVTAAKPHDNEPNPNRRLRIGYVSPDFRRHSVAFFIEPILEAHNRAAFDISCYANVSKPDHITERFKRWVDNWYDIWEMPHKEAADLVRKNKIDILIDFAGHTANNRMPLFAQKPAPVQVTYLGYPDTTGISNMDYRITDQYADPIGYADHLHTEQLVRLPSCFLCYRPFEESPEVAEPPLLKNSCLTFGSFNSLPKVTHEVVTLWSQILQAVPDSRLIMKCGQLGDKQTRERFKKMFLHSGISSDRIDLLRETPSLSDHLAIYRQVDIALDPFPYNGTTTTCEALWMGVPVITLAGNRHSSRVGVSLLSVIGLSDLIAETTQEYVAKAVNLAQDIERLEQMRANLRTILIKSPVTNAKTFTRSLEDAYRKMWQTWCFRTNHT